MVKGKRRVAWMMLQNASVVSIDENVLMLRFPRQGDVKGFTAGQYDEMLKKTLSERYGVHLVIRAISGPPDAGPGGGGGPRRPAPAPAPQPAPAQPQQPPAPPASSTPAAPQARPKGGGERDSSPPPEPRPPAAQWETPPPPEPPDDDDDFYPDDDDMSSGPATAELSGVGLVQRELGGEIIGEYED